MAGSGGTGKSLDMGKGIQALRATLNLLASGESETKVGGEKNPSGIAQAL
jgi:hypothetical protein